MLKKFAPIQLLLILLVGIGFNSCKERAINAFEDEQGIFSVYGALEVGNDRNVIRVRNLLEPFSADSAFPFDAAVTFTDLQTGETSQLRDSVVSFEVGKTHNFILEEELELDSKYQITVERADDGASATSIATTPGLTDASFFPQEFILCETNIEFRFNNVEPTEFVQMEVGAVYQNELHWAPMKIVGKIEYDNQLDIMKVIMSPRNLLVEVFPPVLPDNPYFDPFTLFPTVSCDQLDSNEIMIRYKHFGPEWQPGLTIENGSIDIESGDIENGLGFFGAYRVDSFTVPLSEQPEDL